MRVEQTTSLAAATTRWREVIRTLFVTCAIAFAWPSNTLAEDSGRILVIGGIANASAGHQTLAPMAHYVKDRMVDLGVEDVVVVYAHDREHLAQLIRHGRVDWISQTAYNSSYFIQNANVSVLSRGWRGGSPTYRSVFFVRKDSDLKNLEQVSDHSIAFEHPYSTSAYFVPRMELEALGNLLYQKNSRLARDRKNTVTYSFSQSEYNTAVWVDKGIVDIGVFSDARWQDDNIVPDSFRNQFRVLHETEEIVRALELVRGDLDADIKERLDTILTAIHNDPSAEEVRKSYFDTQRFDKPTKQDIDRLNSFAELMEQGTARADRLVSYRVRGSR